MDYENFHNCTPLDSPLQILLKNAQILQIVYGINEDFTNH